MFRHIVGDSGANESFQSFLVNLVSSLSRNCCSKKKWNVTKRPSNAEQEASLLQSNARKACNSLIQARATYSYSVFSRDSEKRFQVLEILAMPRTKKWYKSITIAEQVAREIDKGETLEQAPDSIGT